MIDLGVYTDVSMKDWRWPSFSPYELRHRFDNKVFIIPEFLDKLQELRNSLGFPFIVNSYYRSPEYNARISTTGRDGPHTTGRAIDIRVYGQQAFEMINAALDAGFTGLGVKQHGSYGGRFIHLDDLMAESRPRIWSYP